MSSAGLVLSFLSSTARQPMSRNGGGSRWVDFSWESGRAGVMERQGHGMPNSHTCMGGAAQNMRGSVLGAVLGPELAPHTRARSFHCEAGGRLVPAPLFLHHTPPYKPHDIKRSCAQPHNTGTAVNAGLQSGYHHLLKIQFQYLRNI